MGPGGKEGFFPGGSGGFLSDAPKENRQTIYQFAGLTPNEEMATKQAGIEMSVPLALKAREYKQSQAPVVSVPTVDDSAWGAWRHGMKEPPPQEAHRPYVSLVDRMKQMAGAAQASAVPPVGENTNSGRTF